MCFVLWPGIWRPRDDALFPLRFGDRRSPRSGRDSLTHHVSGGFAVTARTSRVTTAQACTLLSYDFRSMRFVLILALSLGADAQSYTSPDKSTTATIVKSGPTQSESRIKIAGSQNAERDFASQDGGHGYVVDRAHWTADSQFFVVRLQSSGGHSPMLAPVAFWSRKTNRFYGLPEYTAARTFTLRGSMLTLETWPELKPARVTLSRLSLACSSKPTAGAARCLDSRVP